MMDKAYIKVLIARIGKGEILLESLPQEIQDEIQAVRNETAET